MDANVLMKRILKEACSAGKEQCSEQKVRIESPSGHTIVRDFLKQKNGYSSVIGIHYGYSSVIEHTFIQIIAFLGVLNHSDGCGIGFRCPVLSRELCGGMGISKVSSVGIEIRYDGWRAQSFARTNR